MFSALKTKEKQSAFTLVELLVVVAVLALLASIVFSNLTGAREQAKISNILSFQSQVQSILGADLVVWWNFDHGESPSCGSNKVCDSSGYNNHGNNNGTTFADNSINSLGKCVDFDGETTRSLTLNYNDSLDFESFTISFWGFYRDFIYPKTFGAVKRSNPNCYQSGGKGWDFGHGPRDNGIDFCLADGVNLLRTTLRFNAENRPENLTGRWVHLVFTVDRDRKVVSSFVDGIEQSHHLDISSITGSAVSQTTLSLGTMYGWITDGQVDDFRIYSRALAISEIQSLFAQGSGGYLTRGD